MPLFEIEKLFPTERVSVAVKIFAVTGPIDVIPCSKIPKLALRVLTARFPPENEPDGVDGVGWLLAIRFEAIDEILSLRPAIVFASILLTRRVPEMVASPVWRDDAAKVPEIEAAPLTLSATLAESVAFPSTARFPFTVTLFSESGLILLVFTSFWTRGLMVFEFAKPASLTVLMIKSRIFCPPMVIVSVATASVEAVALPRFEAAEVRVEKVAWLKLSVLPVSVAMYPTDASSVPVIIFLASTRPAFTFAIIALLKASV